jgi:hypothetical protein
MWKKKVEDEVCFIFIFLLAKRTILGFVLFTKTNRFTNVGKSSYSVEKTKLF